MKTLYITLICLASFSISAFAQLESDDMYFTKKDRKALLDAQRKELEKIALANSFSSSQQSNSPIFYEEKQSLKYRRQSVATYSFMNMYQPNCRLGFGSPFYDPFSPWYNPTYFSMNYGYPNSIWYGQNCYFATSGLSLGYGNMYGNYGSMYCLRNTGYYTTPVNSLSNVSTRPRAYDARDSYKGTRNGTSASTIKNEGAYGRNQNFIRSMQEGGRMFDMGSGMNNSRGGSGSSINSGGSFGGGGGRTISSGSSGGGGRSTSSGSGGGGRR